MVIMRFFSVYLGSPGTGKSIGGTLEAQMHREKPYPNYIIYNNKQQGKQLSKFFCKIAKDIQLMYDNTVDRVNTGKGC